MAVHSDENDRIEQYHSAGTAGSGSHARQLIVGLFALSPLIIFYSILISNSVNLPYLDDYDALLGFLNRWAHTGTLSGKISWLFTSQPIQFKLILMHTTALAQLAALGHVNFKVLSAIGNGFIFLLAILLWKMFLPNEKEPALRLAWFIPVPWLLFQLQYWDDLNWATPGLQHIPALFFSLSAIYFLLRGRRNSFCIALGCMALAITSDGNGLLIIPVGLVILAMRRDYRRMIGWLGASIVYVAVYAYHYNIILLQSDAHRSASMFSISDPHSSLLSAILRVRPLYIISFIGNAAGLGFQFYKCSILLGSLLCAFFAYLTYRGYFRRNPTVFFSVLFLLITSIGVAGLRSGYGLEQSLSPRYTIYSALFLIFAWFAIVEEFIQSRREPLLNDGRFLSAVAVAVLFSLSMDLAGAHALATRNRVVTESMSRFEHPTAIDPMPSPAPLVTIPWPLATSSPFNPRARAILIESMRLGIYTPPELPDVRSH